MTDGGSPERVLIVYETEAAARARLASFGYAPDIAAEIAVYLAQATDLPAHQTEIASALAAVGAATVFVEIDALPGVVRNLRPRAARTLIWALTDGFRFYRGSAVPALARLAGFARYGAPAASQHLCQDKFASLAVAQAAGLTVPPTTLLEGGRELGRIGDANAQSARSLLVKPNSLGAKIGIFADSLTADPAEVPGLAGRLWDRYADRAVVQAFIEGDDVRVSFLNLGGDFRAQLGIAALAKDPASETGGAFLTMRDNETLSGAADTEGGRGGFGTALLAAFVPKLTDLRTAADARSQRAVREIEAAAERLATLLGLADYFSMDFRVDSEGRAHFLEFEVCPAVTIYDFQHYLATTHGVGLGAALAGSIQLACGRAAGQREA